MAKILLVEDDKSLREIYGVRLMAEGYTIVSAGDGEEALAMAIKERPDLVISDVMMPKISGFDMLDILRSTTETKDVKVIMMTALSSDDQRARGEALGADRYLVKSQVGIEDVVRTVHDVLQDSPVAAASPTQNVFAAPIPTAATTAEPIVEAFTPAPTPAEPTAPEPAAPAAFVAAAPEPPAPATPVAPQPEPLSPVQPAAPFAPPVPAAPALSQPATIPTPQPIAVPQPVAQPVSQPTPVEPAPTFAQVAPPPAQPVAPQPVVQQPIVAPQPVQPMTMPIQPTPQPAPVPQPFATPAPAAEALPQPTAPFSSPRPASLGDRVINPITPPEDLQAPNMADLMNQELNGAGTPPVPPTPPVVS